MTDRGAMGSRRGNWRARLFVFSTVSALWLLWSGPLTFLHPLLLALWLASAVLVVWLCDRLGLVTDETVPLELTFRTLGYVPWLGGQVILSSLSVLRRAWTPGAKIAPATARIATMTRTDIGLVSYASSITLTPGTLSLEASPSTGAEAPSILVHALTSGGIAQLCTGVMEARVRHVEEASLAFRASKAGPRDDV